MPEQAIGSGRTLQDAAELSVMAERIGRLIREPGSQQDVAKRIAPDTDRLRLLASMMAETVGQQDAAAAKKVGRRYRRTRSVRSRNHAGARQHHRSPAAHAVGSRRFRGTHRCDLRCGCEACQATDAEEPADRFIRRASAVIERAGLYANEADPALFEETRSHVSAFGDLIDQGAATLKAAGADSRTLSRDMERARSKLYGLVTQLGGASERFENLRAQIRRHPDPCRPGRRPAEDQQQRTVETAARSHRRLGRIHPLRRDRGACCRSLPRNPAACPGAPFDHPAVVAS